MKRLSYVFLIIALFGGWSCSETDQITKPAVDTGSLDFSRLHAIGSNMMAGVQNGGLVEGFQNVSVLAMVAQAAGAPAPGQPTVSENGIPPLLYVSDYSGPTIDQLPTPGTPTNLTYPGYYGNISIPQARISDLMTQGAGAGGAYALVLRTLGGTAMTQMFNAGPTTALVWSGTNDILGSVLQGSVLGITPVGAFESSFTAMIDSVLLATGGTVAGNVPDVLDFPYFTTIPPVVVDPTTREPVLHPVTGQFIPLLYDSLGTTTGLPPGSLVLLPATTFLAQGIGIPAFLPGGTGQPLPDAVVLDAREAAIARQAVTDYNISIGTECSARNVPVADIYATFKDARANGAFIHGETYTFDFLTGGLFGVDGVHPSTLGYWLVAKMFITALNNGFGAAIPEPRLPVGPLRDPGLGQMSSNLIPAYSISWEEWQGVLSLFPQ